MVAVYFLMRNFLTIKKLCAISRQIEKIHFRTRGCVAYFGRHLKNQYIDRYRLAMSIYEHLIHSISSLTSDPECNTIFAMVAVIGD